MNRNIGSYWMGKTCNDVQYLDSTVCVLNWIGIIVDNEIMQSYVCEIYLVRKICKLETCFIIQCLYNCLMLFSDLYKFYSM